MEKNGCDPIKISELLTTSYLEQVCRHGFFHCDPHPGNLAVDLGARALTPTDPAAGHLAPSLDPLLIVTSVAPYAELGATPYPSAHPGGRLIYYDFGMMERVEPHVRRGDWPCSTVEVT